MADQNDQASRLAADIDPHLLAFLRTRVNSFIKWDLVRFFHENANTVDTAENIARYTGRDVTAIAPALQELAEAHVLNKLDVSGMAVYTLTSDEATRTLIRRFILACEDRQFRVKAMYHVIRGMA